MGLHHRISPVAWHTLPLPRTLVQGRSDQKGLEIWPGSMRICVGAAALLQPWGMCLGPGAGLSHSVHSLQVHHMSTGAMSE